MVAEITNTKILVIGDLMLDHYIYGTCNRISPEAPVPVVEISRESFTLGGAGNVVKNLVALNCLPTIIGIVGDDDKADIVLNELSAFGISLNGIVKDSDRCTIVKSRVLVANHQLIRLDREVTIPVAPEKGQQILSKLQQIVKEYDIVLISDYNKGLLTPTLLEGVIDICRQQGVMTLVDPKGLEFSKYKGVNIIKPNRKEAVIASGINITDNDTLLAACAKIQEITACESVVVTLSEDGIAIFNNNKLEIISTRALDVVDVTGAGDTVLAALGVALASGESIYEACKFANQAAAIVVSKVGSATATLNEIHQKIADERFDR
ncbi:D-glycero-beta-D-manno-heptose-7-phosphate kinase [Mucilaginibacter terrenus]|uniref:D-glycero-beta-D-manno-heptose-7-phosphate kinase n=1 Tax=Mucilaginibacter terrenus TaxID=2482727 RepID=A0A3E2NVB9_9SPHI|nr:D-glycero-beta-D-manno-heptose-7-phosphate kinase [Mucilaginibacter terrenus]RFZ84800.1 D-glycero-beta-D-manno-heptose-7-phosphate kinase [Mucilaginibacter terrenus]